MMKNLKRVAVLLGVTSPVLFGMSCSTQLRDAAAAGVFDFVTGTTADTLSSIVSLDGLLGSPEE